MRGETKQYIREKKNQLQKKAIEELMGKNGIRHTENKKQNS